MRNNTLIYQNYNLIWSEDYVPGFTIPTTTSPVREGRPTRYRAKLQISERNEKKKVFSFHFRAKSKLDEAKITKLFVYLHP